MLQLRRNQHLVFVARLGYVAAFHYSSEDILICDFTLYSSQAKTFGKQKALFIASEMRASGCYPPVTVVDKSLR